ncbi:hypothetical protein [Halovivax sp.]|uniref:hypothetical protein n=1 Tax=Halovivax sp. TaxID=1935978 RepID=UPI0025BA3036|nr:hypothetical protein [Halovivax sp.]
MSTENNSEPEPSDRDVPAGVESSASADEKPPIDRTTEAPTANPDEIDDRLDRLESVVETQQELIEELENRNETQQETIAQLEATTDERTNRDDSSGLPAVSRRSALAGLAGLAGLGAMSSSASAATPQGQVGTEDRPLSALHTADLVASEIIAETTDYTAIKAETNGEHYNAIHGTNTATSGYSWGVRGDTDSQSEYAYGVRGIASATEGAPTGVGGETDASGDGATGVSGHATASGVEAATKGVEGIVDADADNSSSPEIVPAGVEGTATGDGATHGVRGISESINGRGVMGFATSDDYEHSTFAGSGIGVMGVTDRSGDDDGVSDSGGVFGWATADSGVAYGVLGRNNSPDGWGVRGIDASGDGHGVYSSGDSKTDGDHETTGDTVLGGELSFADETPQRTAGPIAKGWINSDGSIENAVNVSSATWVDDEERYRITITNEHYWFDGYVTVVTPLTHASSRTTSNSGDLVVELRSPAGNLTQTGFQFVTFDLPSGTETTAATSDTGGGDVSVADGTDDERAASSAVPTSDSHE